MTVNDVGGGFLYAPYANQCDYINLPGLGLLTRQSICVGRNYWYISGRLGSRPLQPERLHIYQSIYKMSRRGLALCPRCFDLPAHPCARGGGGKTDTGLPKNPSGVWAQPQYVSPKGKNESPPRRAGRLVLLLHYCITLRLLQIQELRQYKLLLSEGVCSLSWQDRSLPAAPDPRTWSQS